MFPADAEILARFLGINDACILAIPEDIPDWTQCWCSWHVAVAQVTWSEGVSAQSAGVRYRGYDCWPTTVALGGFVWDTWDARSGAPFSEACQITARFYVFHFLFGPVFNP